MSSNAVKWSKVCNWRIDVAVQRFADILHGMAHIWITIRVVPTFVIKVSRKVINVKYLNASFVNILHGMAHI